VDKGTAVAVTAVAGGLVALQAPLNSRLGESVGTFQAALLNFAAGGVVLIVLAALAEGGLGAVRNAGDVSWPYWVLGGFIGAAYVASVLVTVRSLGAGGVTAATIAGQLTVSVAADHFGWLGIERSPVTPAKLVGVVLLGFGVFLVVHD
jgi:transporter family-2 protein